MTIRLRQSTASQEVPLGPFVDATDGFTEETALTIANTDIKVWKAGATSMVDKNSGGATHMTKGVYSTVLDATDTNTIGPLVLTVGVAGARPIRVECEVLDEQMFDWWMGTKGADAISGFLRVDINSIASRDTSAAKLDLFAQSIISGLVNVGSTTTSVVLFSSDPALTINDQVQGRLIVFPNFTGTAALRGQVAEITGFNTSTQTLTVSPPLKTAPAIADVCLIIDGALALPTLLTSAGNMKADVLAVNGDATAADNLKKSALSVASGILAGGSTTTVLQLASISPTPAVTDQLKGRVVLFVNDAATQASMKIQGGRILASTSTSITLEQPLTAAPSSGNVFVVV